MKYYSVFEDETLQEAIANHDGGFNTLEEAIDDAQINEPGLPFRIINERGEVVYAGITTYVE